MSGAKTEARAFLGLGGNIGDPAAAMAAALRALDASAEVTVVAVSSLYRTPPWGLADQPDFLNAVAEIRTSASPRGLLDLCLATEAALKRVRSIRWGPRVIDIDILDFDRLVIDEPGLQLPHPRMNDRAFVLAPLAEIAPDFPVAGTTAARQLNGLDRAGIGRLPDGNNWWREKEEGAA